MAMQPHEAGDLKSESILGAVMAHRQALDTLRYGSFRGVVRDGKLVRFAIEQEWRPADNRDKEVV
jgi:hypothetical protein